MSEVVAEKGYADATVADAISAAGVSRATFYEQFDDKEDCFFAAYDTVMGQLLTYVAEAFASVESGDWVVKIRGGISALLTYLAENPVAARVGIVEAYAAGTRSRERYRQASASFFPFLDSAREMDDRSERIPAQVAWVIVGGITALIFNEVTNGRNSDLPGLLPEMMYLTVASYFGHEKGIEAMRESAVPN